MRIGCFGGTFDPVHCGHLILAESCREALGLDLVRFVVAGSPPHKAARVHATAADRLAMARLAIAGNPAFVVDDRETRRTRISFTIDTVRAMAADHPGTNWSGSSAPTRCPNCPPGARRPTSWTS